MNLNHKLIGILAAILVACLPMAKSAMTAKYKSFKLDVAENPFFGEITSILSDSGTGASFKIPIKQSFSDTAAVSIVLELNGNEFKEFESTLCDVIEGKIYNMLVVKYGLPVGKFPKNCPVAPGDYEVKDFVMPQGAILVAVPAGIYDIKVSIGEPNADPWITGIVEIEITH